MKDSITNPVTFKTTLLQLDQLDQASRNHRMSRSDIIRAGITLILNKLAIRGVTDITTLNDVTKVIAQPVKQPSISIEDTASRVDHDLPNVDMFATSPTVVEDDCPVSRSHCGWD